MATWVVTVSDERPSEVFNTFARAHQYLTDELWWLYEDTNDERYVVAWADIVSWRPLPGNLPGREYSVSAGGLTYKLTRLVVA